MIIKEVQAVFGKLVNKTIKFNATLNIIELPNEGGKTTWCRFIYMMLFGSETDRELVKYIPWGRNEIEGRMVVNSFGKDVEITRKYDRNGKLIVFSVRDFASGQPIFGINCLNCGEKLCGCSASDYYLTAYCENGVLNFEKSMKKCEKSYIYSWVSENGINKKNRILKSLEEYKNGIYCDDNSGAIAEKVKALEEIRKEQDMLRQAYNIQNANNSELIKLQEEYNEIEALIDNSEKDEEKQGNAYEEALSELKKAEKSLEFGEVKITEDMVGDISEQLDKLISANNEYKLGLAKAEDLKKKREELLVDIIKVSYSDDADVGINIGIAFSVFPVITTVCLAISVMKDISFAIPLFLISAVLWFVTWKIYRSEARKIKNAKEKTLNLEQEYRLLSEKKQSVENEISELNDKNISNRKKAEDLLDAVNKRFEEY